MAEEKSNTEYIPVSVAIAAEKPDAGCWDWHFSFREERFENGKIVPWDRTCGRKRRVFREGMYCDEGTCSLLNTELYLETYKKYGPDVPNGFYGEEETGTLFSVKCTPLIPGIAKTIVSISEFADVKQQYFFIVDTEKLYNSVKKSYDVFEQCGGTCGT